MSVLGGMASEQIVALADVDWARGATGFTRWDKATRYKDYRQLLDREKSVDAVTVVIPDHMHATVALAAMKRGKHVYVEKPLTRTAGEARVLTDAAARYNVATQMGNQGYSHDATRVAAGDADPRHPAGVPGRRAPHVSRKAAATTQCSSVRRTIWGPAAAAKVWGCCRDRDGPSTSCAPGR